MSTILGHHHVSMITKNARKNNYFYRNVLGLRRVKVTVNQDDPSMYHLFYGDLTGSPGTELTFFEIPLAGQTRKGTNAISRIGLIVSSIESLTYWQERFQKYLVKHGDISSYGGRPALHFQDEDGLEMVLVVADGKHLPHFESWDKSPIPLRHQIISIGPVEIKVKRLEKLKRTLTELFHYEIVDERPSEITFQSQAGEVFGEIIAKELDGPTEKPGRGSIHHLAIRVKSDEELTYFDEQVKKRGFMSTGIVDRFYFRSLYFRESNGIMFEIATDGPGFTIDGDIESLGEQLDLPPFLEDQRNEIKKNLTPLEEM